jgi:N-acetylglutamate synthase-like GNAT family acetyltransferase
MASEIYIKPFGPEDLDEAKIFTDKWIGADYYGLDDMKNLLESGTYNDQNASFVAKEGEDIVGIRFTFAPGKWIENSPDNFRRCLSFDDWIIPSESMGYFKSLFIHENFQSKGLGRALSEKSLQVLKKMGAKGVLCHSWLESPGNSSQRYLRKIGFAKMKKHPKFWYDVDYTCSRCGVGKCLCTALEMVKYLE